MTAIPFALLLSVSVSLQVRFATCPTWEIVRRDTLWAHHEDTIAVNPLSLTSYRGTLTAIGGDVNDSDRRLPPNNFGGVVVNDNGTAPRVIPRPNAKGVFESTVAVVDSHGRVHALWVDTSSTTSAAYRAAHGVEAGEDTTANALRLWYASYDGRSWSVPVAMPGTAELRWPIEHNTPVLMDQKDRLHVVLVSRLGMPRVVHYQLSTAGWGADTLRLPGPWHSPSATLIDRGDTIDIAYSFHVPDERAPADENGFRPAFAALHLTSLDLGTRAFSVPTEVYRQLFVEAAHAHFLRAADGQLALTWELRKHNAVLFTEMAAAVRHPDGSWPRIAATLRLATDAEQVHSTAVDACGRIHLLLSLVPELIDHRLYVATLDKGNWSTPVEIPIGLTFSGRAQWAAATDGTPRIILSATPWTPKWSGGVAPSYWLLFTMK